MENSFGELPLIETERLVLRKIAIADREDIFEITSNPGVSKYLTWEYHRTIETTAAFVESMVKKYQNREVSQWGIEYKKDKKLIGIVGFVGWLVEHQRAEFTYVLSERYRGMGIMPEAMKEVMKFAFVDKQMNRIEAKVEIDNVASQRVLQKLGFFCEGTLRQYSYVKGKWRDYKLYSMLKSEYQRVTLR